MPNEQRALARRAEDDSNFPEVVGRPVSQSFASGFLAASLEEQLERDRHIACRKRNKCRSCAVRSVRRAVEQGAIASVLTCDSTTPEYQQARLMAREMIRDEDARQLDETEALLAERIIGGEVRL